MHRGPPRQTKLSLEALMIAGHYATINDLGKVLGLNRSALQQLKGRGVPIHRADEFAIKCGFHPTQVWGDDFYQAQHEPRVA